MYSIEAFRLQSRFLNEATELLRGSLALGWRGWIFEFSRRGIHGWITLRNSSRSVTCDARQFCEETRHIPESGILTHALNKLLTKG